MRATYAAIGLVLIAIVAGAYYFTSQSTPQADPLPEEEIAMLTLTSTAFSEGEGIPAKYTCDAENTNPALSISGVPQGTVSLVLIMDDPDVPKALKADGVFDHWVVYSVPPTTTEIPEGFTGTTQGLNGRAEEGYTGPCPPPQYEPTEHRYFFKLYALDTELSFLAPPTKKEVEAALEGHVLEETSLMGTYDRAPGR